MKKVLALVLALTLFAVPLCTAAAAGTDLSGMTNEELTALKALHFYIAQKQGGGIRCTIRLPSEPKTPGTTGI